MKVDGVYYFLGNFHQHISHVLPLHKKIGGTVVVTSKQAEAELKAYKDVEVVRVDDKPSFWLHVNEENDISKTINFLNQNAEVVIFYDTFYWDSPTMIVTKPSLFLSHGNGSVKSVLIREGEPDGRWGWQLNHHTKVATLGRDFEKMLIERGLEKSKIVRINNVRVDEIIEKIHDKSAKENAQRELAIQNGKKTVAYMPTYWGPTSVMDVGLKILKNISDDYNVIFWPHPQTPKKIIEKYRRIIKARDNITFPQDNPSIELSDIYNVADVFVVDHTTSVVSDMMITKKPMIYAFGSGDNHDSTVSKSPIRSAVERSWHVDESNVNNINGILDNALGRKYRLKSKLLSTLFVRQLVWLPNGGALKKTIKIIQGLTK